MSEKSSSSGSDEDVDPESGQPVELGGVLSKVTMFCRSNLYLLVCKPGELVLSLMSCTS